MKNTIQVITAIWEDKFLPYIELGGDVEYFIVPSSNSKCSFSGAFIIVINELVLTSQLGQTNLIT